ncbi:MAG: hypothetical protein ACFCUI_11015 [Bernardetiaceae bacterium]
MTNKELQKLGLNYTPIVEKKYGQAWVIPTHKSIVCELTDSYVPIEKFKEIFIEMSEKTKGQDIVRFVFDKRHLRVFHQPSMEWYFIEWKTEMYHRGLIEHRKLLPQAEAWFTQAVKAGRALITEKYPDNIIEKLDIQYCETIADALR